MRAMKLLTLTILLFSLPAFAARPKEFLELLPYVQAAPNQGDTNTCWFMASTGAMELLLNKVNNVKNPPTLGPYDLAESFLIWQKRFHDTQYPPQHFIQELVKDFNFKEAIHAKDWPFNALTSDGRTNMGVWEKHPEFVTLPRIKVPELKSELLFSKGRKRYSTNVLDESDLEVLRETLAKRKSPIIVNVNDEDYWHVVLIVGYDDNATGSCYQIEESECNKKGAFYVRDSNGTRYEARAYNWFLIRGNAAAVVELR